MTFDRVRRLGAGLLVLLFAGAAQAQMRITEWMYSGAGGEFVELTNVGTDPVDMAGWSYDDDSVTPGVFGLTGFGVVQSGESVVFTESDAEAFRTDWGLCAGVKILGGYTNNIGRNDQINIFDAGNVLADMLTYGDQNFPGSIRTQGASGWVSAAGLGADDVFEWTLSSVGDGEGSLASSGGAIGSPGRSTHGGHDPCDSGPGDIVPSTIATGLRFACGLDADGFAYCWGSDSGGQLGNGATITATMVSPYPVDMSGLPAGTRFASIVAGGTSACGLTSDGIAYCWGQDTFGQLGNGVGVSGDQPFPVAVDMSPLVGTVFVSLAAGAYHVCGVADDGIGYCWGRNDALGLPPDVTGNQQSPSPVDMALLPAGTTLVSMSAARGHTCGLASDGSLYCWGVNNNGVIGVGTSSGSYPITPVDISGLPGGTAFAQVTTGDSHTCALTTEHVAYCWGAGINGATGNGAQSADILLPNPVVTNTIPTGTHFVLLEGGATNTCGILDTGAAYCWGFGLHGALGTGDGTSRYSPHPVATSTLPVNAVFTEISSSENLTCGATAAGEFYCWGRDDQGQLGNGPLLANETSHFPTLVEPFAPVTGLPPTIAVADAVIVGSVGDPTNPGTVLTFSDPDTDVAELVVDVSSSNEAVIPATGITVTGTGTERTVNFDPTGRGVATISFIVTDPEGNGQSTTMQYGSSNQALDPSGRYHHRISDASAGLGVGDGHMILLNDETNTIFLHREDQSGVPVKTWSFSSSQLGTSSEIDFEGIARSGDLVLMSGSHGNNRSGSSRPERRTFIAATITGSGADTELVFLGRYNNLWTELRAWDQSNGHGLGADALGFIAATASGVQPNAPSGFNIEAMEFALDGETVYLGFRAPTIDIGGIYHALIVPLLNVDDIVNGTPGTGPAQFGEPIFLDLGGRSIRAMASNGMGGYLISAGPSPQNGTWALYTWNGDPSHPAQFNQQLPTEDLLTGGTWEAIGTVPNPLQEGAIVRVIADSGDSNFYGTGATKDLQPPYQKSYSQVFALAETPGGDVDGMRITEWMYSGAGGEFVELTNVGTEPVDMNGWSYDDDSATPGGFDLSGFGIVQPGESVVFTESDPETFRSHWGLCSGVKIIGPYTNNLGRNDQINIFDGANASTDVLTYGDEDFPGSIRTQEASGWVSAAGLGADDVFEWALSSVGDGEGSLASFGGAIGSPGRSTRASVPYEPCDAVIEHTLAVTLEGGGQGTVTGKGIACPGDCEETYIEGTDVSLVAAVDPGFVFIGWNGDCTGTDACTLVMDGDKAVAATFIAAASIDIDPDSLASTLVAGDSEALPLTIANSNFGGQTLDWQVTEADACALPGWAFVDPTSGSVLGGKEQMVSVVFDAAVLVPGDYTATLCLASNDPAQPIVMVPLSLTVTPVPAPVLTFDPAALDFGEFEIGTTSPVLVATLHNSGDADATGVSFDGSGGDFMADPADCGSTLAAGASCAVSITFAPSSVGPVSTMLEVDSAEGVVASLGLQGEGVAPPDPETDVAVRMEARREYLRPGQLLDYLISVDNRGSDAAMAASIATTLSSALDADFATWQCIGPSSSGCTATGQGDLADTGLIIPAGGSISYVVSAPVRWDADGEVASQAQTGDEYDTDPGNDTAEAVSQIVLYRDGFQPYGDGVSATPLVQVTEPFAAGDVLTMNGPAPGRELIETVLAAAPDGTEPVAAMFRVEQLNADAGSWVRLVVRDESGGEYAGVWLAAQAGTELTLRLVDVEPSDRDAPISRDVRLASPAGDTRLPLPSTRAAYRLWTSARVVLAPAGNDAD